MSVVPAQTITLVAAPIPEYPFLSQPPPQKKHPVLPLPSPPHHVPAVPCSSVYTRRRSATISAWASAVYPGSPAPRSPCSPRRRGSVSSARRPSISRLIPRRPSITSTIAQSASFLNFFDTPTTASRATPSVKDFKPDLASLGYTSVFVQLPNTPKTPASRAAERPVLAACITSARGLKRFRSLSALRTTRNRSKVAAMPSPPPLPKSKMPKSPSPRVEPSVKQKKTSHAAKKTHPPPLAMELALAQFMDGGKIEDHIKRFAAAQAKAEGAVRVDGRLVGVGDVHRDGAGGVWRDQDEQWEARHLLAVDDQECGVDWVAFVDEERRESVSSLDSDLDPRYAMHPEEAEADDVAIRPGMSVLALPSRNRRTAKHLRKPEFLLDTFPVPHSTHSHSHSHSHSHPQTTRTDISTGKARRRPAPLTLTPPSPVYKCPTNPLDAEQTRRDFLDASFAPAPPVPSCSPTTSGKRVLTSRKAVLKPSVLNVNVSMRGLFRGMSGKKTDI